MSSTVVVVDPESNTATVSTKYIVSVNRSAAERRRASWHAFPSNWISSTRFPTWLLIPGALWLELRSVGLMFHLFVCCLNLVPGGPGWPVAALFVPWVFAVVVAITPHVVLHVSTWRRDARLNASTISCLRYRGPDSVIRSDTAAGVDRVRWDAVVPGELVYLQRGERFGADCVVLSTGADDHTGFLVDPGATTTGETVLRPGRALLPARVAAKANSWVALEALDVDLHVPFPREEVSSWSVSVFMRPPDGHPPPTAALAVGGPESLVLRESVLMATPWVWAVVIYTGDDCVVARSDRRNDERSVFLSDEVTHRHGSNAILVLCVLAASAAAAFVGVAGVGYAGSSQALSGTGNATTNGMWYVAVTQATNGGGTVPYWRRGADRGTEWALLFVCYIVYFSPMLPLLRDPLARLAAALHGLKVQWDPLLMLRASVGRASSGSRSSAAAGKLDSNDESAVLLRASVSSNDVLWKLRQITHACLDKTGTITTNDLSAVDAFVSGQRIRLVGGAEAKTLALREPKMRRRVAHLFTAAAVANVVFPSVARQQDLASAATTARSLLAGELAFEYDATSRDEEALVRAAAENGVQLVSRTTTGVAVIDSYERRLRVYRIMCVLDFTPERRRMTILLQEPSDEHTGEPGEYVVFTKGAEESVVPLLTRSSPGSKAAKALSDTLAAAAAMSNSGNRPFLFASRHISSADLKAWLARRAALLALQSSDVVAALSGGREQQQNVAAQLRTLDAEIERDLRCVGVIGLKDNVAAGAKLTLQYLRESSIRTWMVTGDSRGTAAAVASLVNLGCATRAEFGIAMPPLNGAASNALPPVLRHIDLSSLSPSDDRVAIVMEQLRRAVDSSLKYELVLKAARTSQANEGGTLGASLPPTADRISSTQSSLTSRGWARPVLVVIDGATLHFVLDHPECASLFAEVCRVAQAGIGCRMAPTDKSKLLLLMKRAREGAIMLAIGDGSNDTPMLASADVGVALTTGEASLSARRASDVVLPSLAQIPRLIARHGRGAPAQLHRATSALFALGASVVTIQVLTVVYPTAAGQSDLSGNHYVLLCNFLLPLTAIAMLILEPRDDDWNTALGDSDQEPTPRVVSVAGGCACGVLAFLCGVMMRVFDVSPSYGAARTGHIGAAMTMIVATTYTLWMATFPPRLVVAVKSFRGRQTVRYLTPVVVVIGQFLVPMGLLITSASADSSSADFWAFHELLGLSPLFWIMLFAVVFVVAPLAWAVPLGLKQHMWHTLMGGRRRPLSEVDAIIDSRVLRTKNARDTAGHRRRPY